MKEHPNKKQINNVLDITQDQHNHVYSIMVIAKVREQCTVHRLQDWFCSFWASLHAEAQTQSFSPWKELCSIFLLFFLFIFFFIPHRTEQGAWERMLSYSLL